MVPKRIAMKKYEKIAFSTVGVIKAISVTGDSLFVLYTIWLKNDYILFLITIF